MSTVSKSKIIKTKNIKLSNTDYAKKYADNGFVPFTLNIYSSDNKKKY